MKIYIAGPVSGIPLYNLPAFQEARALLEKSGVECVIPHDIYHPGDSKCPAVIWCEAMLKCLPELESSDAVLFLPGWEGSPGARREHCIVKDKNIPIITIDTQLKEADNPNMTERQQQALDWIKQQTPPPTMQELGDYLGVSRQRASAIVHYLAANGHLTIKEYHPRGIRT